MAYGDNPNYPTFKSVYDFDKEHGTIGDKETNIGKYFYESAGPHPPCTPYGEPGGKEIAARESIVKAFSKMVAL